MDKKKVLPVVLVASIAGEALLPKRHFDTLAPQPHTELEIAVPFATTVAPVSASGSAGGGRMKLSIGKPSPTNYQRPETDKWVTCGTIPVHNDSEKVSLFIEVPTGAEYDQKEEAVRDFVERADWSFVKRILDNGGAAQLHRVAA